MASNLEELLAKEGISFQRFDHAAVFTCAEAAKIECDIPGVNNKNLFFSDPKRTRYFIVTACASKQIDLKRLAALLEVKSLRFGSAEELLEVLKIEPGSVSMLALINDAEARVEIVIDEEVWNNGQIQCHPLINTATFILETDGLRRFIAACGHRAARIMAIPAK